MLPERGRIHFIGIGGAGMSALAKVLLERGREVSGSDARRSRTTDALAAMGARIDFGHDAAAVGGAAGVVYSSAVKSDNPEIVAARSGGALVLRRGEALASLLQGTSSVIVAGTHGKTTTASMIVAILKRAGLHPTYLVGGAIEAEAINAGDGGGDIAVAESDESDGSFLLLEPSVAVITNIEPDHLDHWKTMEAIEEAFDRFIAGADCAVVRAQDSVARLAAERAGSKLILYGERGEVFADEILLEAHSSSFVLVSKQARTPVRLEVAGAHNVTNALAAAAACLELGIATEEIAAGLESFSGVPRRYQLRGRRRGITIIDDYAHHPTEIAAALAAARLGSWRRVVAVFQPHLFSRTAALQFEFGAAFGDADVVVVTDVYAAREDPLPGINGKLISDAVGTALPGRPLAYLARRDELLAYLFDRVRPGDLVLTLGAGDITTVADDLLEALEEEAA
jgi:UDP-N-acetylmuramate--alanine ligase